MSTDEHLSTATLPRDLKDGMEVRVLGDWVTVIDVTKYTRTTSGGYHRKSAATRYAVCYRRQDGLEGYIYAAPGRRLETCARHKPPEGAEE